VTVVSSFGFRLFDYFPVSFPHDIILEVVGGLGIRGKWMTVENLSMSQAEEVLTAELA